MMRHIFSSLLLFLIPFFAFSQAKFKIEGHITDSAGKAMEMTSVVLLAPEDSSFRYYGITNLDGLFRIEDISEGNYILQLSFIGYKTTSEVVKIDSEHIREWPRKFVMEQESNVLTEIIIEGERIPIIINKDTVSYDAEAFQVRGDETVEDLLRRLPGLEVDPDGRVTAQGEEVKKVLVDGKEFFGGNVQLATQNLPADAIKKVKVYDRKSEEAMFTGVDDGARDKTIDLELKDDRKKGIFGDLEVGGGTDERYKIKGGAHAFSPKTRLSLLANTNNLNQFGFDWSDVNNMMGAEPGQAVFGIDSRAEAPSGNMGFNSGVFSSATTGLNLNFDPNKRHRLNANYYLSYADRNLVEDISAQEFNNDNIVQTNEDRRQRDIRLRHQTFAEYRFEPDSLTRIELSVAGSMDDHDMRQAFQVLRQGSEGPPLQDGTRNVNQVLDNLEYSGKLLFIRKFKKPKRNIKLESFVSDQIDRRDDRYTAINEFPAFAQVEFIDQIRDDRDNNLNINNLLEFTEPIGDKHRITAGVEARILDQRRMRNVTDVPTGLFLDSLSPEFQLNREEYRAGLRYVYAFSEQNELSVNLNQHQFRQGAEDLREGSSVETQQWDYFLPSITWFRRESGIGNMYVNLGRSVNLPRLNQWIANPDYTDPLYIVEGNPALQPEISNTASISRFKYNSFKQTNYYIYGNISLTENPIVQAQEIDTAFRRRVRPINADEMRWSTNLRGNYRFPIKKLKTFIRLNSNFYHANVNMPINGEDNFQENTSVNSGVTFSNFRSGKWDFSVQAIYGFNWANYSRQPELNRYFTQQNYIGTIVWRPNKRITLRTEFDYTVFSEETFAGALAIPRWNANFSYALIENGDLLARLTIFDILNRNTGLQRYADANFIRQTESNTLTRYTMVSLIYKFRRQ